MTIVNPMEVPANASLNLELFLPSYAGHDAHSLEHKQEPVEEIVLTDEEAAAMLPQ